MDTVTYPCRLVVLIANKDRWSLEQDGLCGLALFVGVAFVDFAAIAPGERKVSACNVDIKSIYDQSIFYYIDFKFAF